jgi:RecA/RadA recombinase
MAKAAAKNAALTKFMASFEKSYGEGSITQYTNEFRYDVIPSGSIALDHALGCGGFIKGRIAELWGTEQLGKGHPTSTGVLTPHGWKPIGNICQGDEVIGSGGRPVRVTGVFPRGELEVYRVRFTDGSSVLCDPDHLWHVQSPKHRQRGTHVILSVQELRGRSLLNPDGSGRYKIPLVHAVEYARQEDLEIDPYLLGVLLADGYFESGIISTNNVEVIDNIRHHDPSIVIKEHFPSASRRWYPSGKTPGENPVRQGLKSLGLWGHRSADKFIPEKYLRASVSQRIALLHGMMDCDGSLKNKQHKAVYSSFSPHLASGVQDLVESLGGTGGMSRRADGCYEVRVFLPPEIDPFSVSTKLCRWMEHPHRRPSRIIHSIVPEGRAPVVCIGVDAEDSLYVTERHLVTHNSTQCLITTAEAQKKEPDKVQGWIDVENTFDPAWARRHGVDMEKLVLSQPGNAEEVADIAKDMVMSGLFNLITLDSVGAMISQKEKDKDADEATVALVAKVVTRMTKIMAAEAPRAGVVVLIINQARANIGAMGRAATIQRTGGFALSHVTTHRLHFRRGKDTFVVGTKNDTLDSRVQVGQQIAIHIEKNKVAPPKRTALLTYFNQDTDQYGPTGIDRAYDAYTMGSQVEVFGRRGSWYDLPDGTEHRSKDALLEYLRATPSAVDLIRDRVLATMGGPIITNELMEG